MNNEVMQVHCNAHWRAHYNHYKFASNSISHFSFSATVCPTATEYAVNFNSIYSQAITDARVC